MHPLAMSLACALCCLVVACGERARSVENPPRIMEPGLPRAGVPIEPAARHGGMVMLAGTHAVEFVVAPDGVVKVYPRDHDDNDIAPGGARGVIVQRSIEKPAVRATLQPDRSSGAMTARLDPPSGERTEYDVELTVENQRVHTGVAVVDGGTLATLALQAARGDRPTIPIATDVLVPSTAPPVSVGGGPPSR
jgi:hypothetical protein